MKTSVLSSSSSSSSSSMASTPHFNLRCGISHPSHGILGSSYLEFGQSKVCVYVFTPRPMTRSVDFDKGILECEVSLAGHLVGRADEVFGANHHPEGVAGILLRLSKSTVDALTPAVRLSNYAKCAITMTAVLLDSSADDQAALINCASAALCDAAVEMRDIVTAFSLNASLPLGPPQEEEEVGSLLNIYCEVACLCALDEITSIELKGKCSALNLMQIVERLKHHCAAIRNHIASVLTLTK